MSTTAKRNDRFSISYSLWIGLLLLLFAYADEFDRILNLWLLLVPLLLLPTIAVVGVWLASLVLNIFRRRWKRVASVLAAPFVAYLFFWSLGQAGINPERIRFEFGRRHYLAEVAQLPQTGAPRLKLFNWGGRGGVATVSVFYNLIYDESDEIALPPEKRSPEWQDRAGALCPGTQMCSILDPSAPRTIEIRKFRDHFYLATEWYE